MEASHARAEQRRETRQEFFMGQLLVVELISEGPVHKTHGVVLNISRGGMAVQTFHPLIQGRSAQTHLSIPNASIFSGEGFVAWEKQGGLAGIRFLNPAPNTLPELPQRLLRDCAPQNSDSTLPLFTCRNESSNNTFDMTLHLFACSVMALTGASGAAIAVGNSDGMECRASVGSAPEVGTQLRPDSGLSGHSLRTGAVILCNDASADSRVNAAAAQQMNTLSIVIVPIPTEENVEGLLEVFSPERNYFSERHMRQLQPLVSVLSEAIKEERSNNIYGESGGVVVAVTTASETAEVEKPAETFTTCSQLGNRSRTVAIALGILAALLVVVVAVVWFTSRERIKSARNDSSSIGAQNYAPQRHAGTNEQGAATTVKPVIGFDPPLISQKEGTTFKVDVVLKGAKDIWSAPMQILYDPQELQVITVASGNLLDRDGQAATLVQRVDSVVGRIDISISRPLSAPGISGDGVVCTLVFLSKASGRSKLRVEQTGLRDTSTKIVSVNSSEATVNISRSASPAGSVVDQEVRKLRSSPVALSPRDALDKSVKGFETRNELLVVPGKPLTVDDVPLPVRPLVKSTELKTPNVDAAIALVPRPPKIPSFGLDRTFKAHTNWVTAVTFSADGQRLISGSWDRSVKSWDVATGRALSTIASKITGIQASAVSHDGRLIAAEDASDNIRIWNANTGGEVRTMKGNRVPWDRSWVYSIAFSPDDGLLAAALNGQTIRLWDVNSGHAVRDLRGSSREFMYAAFSPNGRWLATGGDARTIEIWDLTTGKVLRTLKGHKQDVCAVAFSPDGRWLASASKDRTVKLWDFSTGRDVQTLTGHQNSVTSLAFSPNSRWLATSGWDKTVRIWDVATGRQVQILTGYPHPIYALAFDSRGGWLATGSADGTIKLWRLARR